MRVRGWNGSERNRHAEAALREGPADLCRKICDDFARSGGKKNFSPLIPALP